MRILSKLVVSGWICGVGFAFLFGTVATWADQPNIVVIMVDDMGYECIGANGCLEYATPVVDGLAASGLRFSNAHSTPVCTPTRTQIMSGRYGHRNYTKFGQFIESETCFAELLRAAGYATMMAGKWQLNGYDLDTTLDDFGFDEYALYNLPGFDNMVYDSPGAGRYWDADIYTNGHVHLDHAEDEYGPDTYTDLVVDFINRKAGAGQPFLVYYAMALVHNPFVPTPHSTFTWPAGGAAEIYSTMDDPVWFKDEVEYADYLTGRIVQALEDAGVRNNTIVIFTGDNGTNEDVTTMTVDGEVPGGKNTVKKTGTHVPFIVNWPSRAYSTNEIAALWDHSDMLPTLVDLAGAEMPSDRVIDGFSIAPVLRGETTEGERDAVFCEWFGGGRTKSSLRDFALDERYKYFINGEFYDMDADPEQVSPIAEADMTPEQLAARNRLRDKIASVYSKTDDNIQLAKNPDFGNGFSKWRHFGNGWVFADGMANVTGTAGDPPDLRWMYQYHPAHPGQTYFASADVVADGLSAGAAKVYLKLEFVDKDKNVLSTATGTELVSDTDPARTLFVEGEPPLNTQYLKFSLVAEPLAGGEFSVGFDRVLLKTGKLRNPDVEFQNNAGWIKSGAWSVSAIAEDASSGSFGFSTTVLGGQTDEVGTRTIMQTIEAVPGETYSISADVRAAGTSGGLEISASYVSGDDVVQNQSASDGSTLANERPNAGAFATGTAFNGFYFFALPDLSGIDPANITNVVFTGELTVNSAANSPEPFNCDVYGYGQNTLGASGSDYQVPGSAYIGMLVQDNYLVPGSPTDALYTINSAELKTLVQSLYNPDGTPASTYLVLRMQPDWDAIPTLVDSARYRINSHDPGFATPGLQFSIDTGSTSLVSAGEGTYASGDGIVHNQASGFGATVSTDRPNCGAYATGEAFNGFYFFALPDLGGTDPADIANVVFAGVLAVNTASLGGFNCDVYGYGHNSLGVSASDYQVPGSTYTGTLVQDDYLTPDLATGQSYSIDSAELKTLVQSLYNPDGTPASTYLVFRMQPDWSSVPVLSSGSRYRINSHNTDYAIPTLLIEKEVDTSGGRISIGCVQAEFLDATGAVLATHQGAAVTTDQPFTEMSVQDMAAPAGTAFIRAGGVVGVPSVTIGNEYWSFDNFMLNDSVLPDLDRDGLSDADEAVAGTDPAVAASCFAITNTVSAGGGMEIGWLSVAGRTYDLLWAPSLSSNFVPVATGLDYPVANVPVATTNDAGFYKIGVRIK